jgi:phage-related protein
MYEIIFYEDENGYSEFEDFIRKLRKSNQKKDRVLLNKIHVQLDYLEEQGLWLREPISKRIKGTEIHLFELRPIPERIFYVAWTNNRFIILNHYTKKQTKTDTREIDKAVKMFKEWRFRNGN